MIFLPKKYATAYESLLNKPMPDRYEYLLIVGLSSLLTLFLYADALKGYWRFDDGTLLMFATKYSPWQYFFDPAVTLGLSGANVTPWAPFFYDINLALFGFEPSAFYAHSLVLLIASAVALYTLLRLWFSTSAATLGMTLFLTGKPTYHLAHELMCSHYLTGLLFSLCCLILFTCYIRSGNSIRLITAVIFYALAMSCKEVYVPLMGLLLFMPTGTLKQRLWAMSPFALVAMGYFLWRHAVLGVWIGGYKPAGVTIDYYATLQQLGNIPFMLFADHGWGLLSLIIVTLMSLVAFWKKQVNLLLLATALFILFVPLLPLTLFPGITQPDRYLVAPWVAISIWIAFIFDSLNIEKITLPTLKSLIKPLSACVFIIASYLGHIIENQSAQAFTKKSEDIYRFAIETDFSQKALLLDSSVSSNYWTFVSSEARNAYNIAHNIEPQAILITPNKLNGLLSLSAALQERPVNLLAVQFYQYKRGKFKPTQLKPSINKLLTALEKGKDKTLQIEFNNRNNILNWHFQPEAQTLNYSAIIWKGKPELNYAILALPPKSSYPWRTKDAMQISVVIKSPEGWLASTPKLDIAAYQQVFAWQGKTDVSAINKELEYLLLQLDH